MPSSVILGTARTPFGKMGGGLSSLDATDLGGAVIEAALERSGVAPEQVEQVVFGQVLQAGQGQIPSRQAQIKGGIPKEVPSETINKVCASGMRTVGLADLAIRAGDLNIGVAGGMESMSNAYQTTDAGPGKPSTEDREAIFRATGSVIRFDDVFQDFLQFLWVSGFLCKKALRSLRITQDGRQWLIEFVSDGTGKLSKHRHARKMGQLITLLCRFSFGLTLSRDIGDRRQDQRPIGSLNGIQTNLQRHLATILALARKLASDAHGPPVRG